MRDARKRSRRADAANNRERIMAAARSVLAERGFGAEVMQIADCAGVGAGTLYRNFPTRQHLIADIVREMARTFEGAVVEASRRESAPAALDQIVRAGFDLVERYGRLVLDVLGGGAGQGFESDFNREMVRQRIRQICERGVADGDLPDALDIEFALGMLQGLFSPRALEFLLASHTPSQIADLAIAFYLTGLGARPVASGLDVSTVTGQG